MDGPIQVLPLLPHIGNHPTRVGVDLQVGKVGTTEITMEDLGEELFSSRACSGSLALNKNAKRYMLFSITPSET